MKEISWNKAIELGSPYPYVLVTTISDKGRPNIIGISWWTIVSWNPRMMAIVVGLNKQTSRNLEHNKEFVVCFPSEEQVKGAWFCGTVSGKKYDKFKETGFKAVPSKVVRPPIIANSTLAYECQVVSEVKTGDHILYIADVVAIHGSPELAKHLVTIRYDKLISMDYKGYLNFDLEFK